MHFPTGHYRHLEVEEQHEVEVHISKRASWKCLATHLHDGIEVLEVNESWTCKDMKLQITTSDC